MPHNATLPAFDKPEILLQSVDLQYGQVIVGVVGLIINLALTQWNLRIYG